MVAAAARAGAGGSLSPRQGFRYAVPRLPRPLACRSHLFARLGGPAPLVVVRGPVGCGKSTLAAQWLIASPEEVDAAWTTVDRDANSSTDLWEEIRSALAVAGVVSAYDDQVPLRTAVRRAVNAWEAPLTLVVDAYERLREAEVDREVAELLRHCPNLRMIVCTRDDRNVAEECREQGVPVDVIGVTDLLLTLEDTEALFNRFGLRMGAARLQALHRETTGWPALLWTIGQALASQPVPRARSVEEVAQEYAHLWAHREVLPALGIDAKMESVYRLAVPQVLDDDVARFVSGGADPAPVLDCLRAHGLVSASTDGAGHTYAWPSLVRTSLRSIFAAEQPCTVRRLDADLAGWFRAQGDPLAALMHSLDAGDIEGACAIVEQSWLQLFGLRREQLQGALARIPAEALEQRPKLRTLQEMVARLPSSPPGPLVSEPIDDADLAEAGRSADARRLLDDGLLRLLAWRRRGDLDRSRDLAARLTTVAATAAEAAPERVADLLGTVYTQSGLAHLLAGESHLAKIALLKAYRAAPDSMFPHTDADVAAKLALVHAAEGDVAAAEAWAARVHALTDAASLTSDTVNRYLAGAEAFVAIDRLAGSALREKTPRAVPQIDDAADERWAFQVYPQAVAALLWGDCAAMLQRIRLEKSWYESALAPRSFPEALVLAAEVDLLLALGATDRASALLDGVTSRQPLVAVARARLALLTGDDVTAVRLSAQRRWDDDLLGRARGDLALLHACGLLAGGDAEAAAAAFVRAGVVSDAGVLRPFAMVPRDDLRWAARHVPSYEAIVEALDRAEVPEVFPPAGHRDAHAPGGSGPRHARHERVMGSPSSARRSP